jgi:hypothetical protein
VPFLSIFEAFYHPIFLGIFYRYFEVLSGPKFAKKGIKVRQKPKKNPQGHQLQKLLKMVLNRLKRAKRLMKSFDQPPTAAH